MLHITPEERASLQWLADGRDSSHIAWELGISEREVEGQLASLFARMGARTTTEAIAAATTRGLLRGVTAP
ncbi:MAG TPA: LuxR C-terminal-related transcriptional regulator [Vicinamibacterales bacterium]|nr:LuxR C-terminal-related transcriptional regulator [Vicinamibacterales bacterium]